MFFAKAAISLPRILRKGRIPLVILFAVAVFAFTQGDWLNRIDTAQRLAELSIDLRFKVRHNVPAHPDVLIVGITASSFDTGLLGKLAPESETIALMQTPWPWNRKVFADLITRLMESGAKVVALDILFHGEREGDAELAEAINRYRDRVVLASTLIPETTTAEDRRHTFITPHSALLPSDGTPVIGYGFFRPAPDGIVRRVSYRTSDLREHGEEDEKYELSGSPNLTGFAALAVEKFTGRPAPGDANQLINFQGPAATYRYIPVEEVFADSLFLTDPKFKGGKVFRDKLVFVGPIAETFHDVHTTPFGDMPGVELHAQTAGDLLAGTKFSDSTPSANWWTIAAFSILPALAVLLVRQAAIQASILILLGAGFVLAALLLFTKARLVIPMVPPLFALVAVGSFGSLLHFIIEQLERTRIRSVLDRYVSKNVARHVMEQGDSFENTLRGVRKSATVLFSDVRGFTTIFESSDPEHLVGQLNEYFLEMVDAVLHEAGTLQKFIGDAIMAVWGDTHSTGYANDAARAVRTGLQMQEALKRLNARWADVPDRIPLQIGIGINHGEVIVGNMGHPQRMEFTVLGDAINLAARLETATKQFDCEMLVGQKAEELTREQFVYRRVDRLRLKGKTLPVEVYTPLSTIATPAPEWLAPYHNAIDLYRKRQFAEAASTFRAVNAELGGSDFLCTMYAARCDQFVKTPPDPSWDGAHTLTEK